ncbi:Uncharacterized protein dnl_15550 [Desulfonema limicola]|uniref:Uncharacterized protein n=1 Tax=Desulfonema limicola TaxID=45656 RepID=A0A975B5U6_9BACT|nr:Uncharacterized protein dnl_15550 [Desulfonema limicola]
MAFNLGAGDNILYYNKYLIKNFITKKFPAKRRDKACLVSTMAVIYY